MQPCNSSIIIEPLDSYTQESTGVRTPESALLLARGRVVAIGNQSCVVDGVLVDKDVLLPKLEPGKIVHYIKLAEERLDVDAAYRIPTSEFKYNLIIRIQDIRAIE